MGKTDRVNACFRATASRTSAGHQRKALSASQALLFSRLLKVVNRPRARGRGQQSSARVHGNHRLSPGSVAGDVLQRMALLVRQTRELSDPSDEVLAADLSAAQNFSRPLHAVRPGSEGRDHQIGALDAFSAKMGNASSLAQ